MQVLWRTTELAVGRGFKQPQLFNAIAKCLDSAVQPQARRRRSQVAGPVQEGGREGLGSTRRRRLRVRGAGL